MDKYTQRACEVICEKHPNMSEEEAMLYAENAITSDMFEQFKREHYEKNGVILGEVPSDYYRANIDQCRDIIAQWVARIKHGDTDGLLIVGDVGVGKTYSSLAAINSLACNHTVGFISEGGIIRMVKTSFERYLDSEQDIINKLVNPYVLVIDDLGKVKATEWSMGYIFEVINERLTKCRPTIITSQYEGKLLHEKIANGSDKETADAILSRLRTFTVCKLTGQDRRKAS